jgi:hypothetical protein
MIPPDTPHPETSEISPKKCQNQKGGKESQAYGGGPKTGELKDHRDRFTMGSMEMKVKELECLKYCVAQRLVFFVNKPPNAYSERNKGEKET